MENKLKDNLEIMFWASSLISILIIFMELYKLAINFRLTTIPKNL